MACSSVSQRLSYGLKAPQWSSIIFKGLRMPTHMATTEADLEAILACPRAYMRPRIEVRFRGDHHVYLAQVEDVGPKRILYVPGVGVVHTLIAALES